MALRNQPYLPLFIQDYMTDEKLNECSAATQGIYIRIMCLMHKSETYGKILLKQKYKQAIKQGDDFCLEVAKQFAKHLKNHLTFTEAELVDAIRELLCENVCCYEDGYLVQRRMVRDNYISEQRAKAGKKGGEKTQKFAQANGKANSGANSEYENEYENETLLKFGVNGGGVGEEQGKETFAGGRKSQNGAKLKLGT